MAFFINWYKISVYSKLSKRHLSNLNLSLQSVLDPISKDIKDTLKESQTSAGGHSNSEISMCPLPKSLAVPRRHGNTPMCFYHWKCILPTLFFETKFMKVCVLNTHTQFSTQTQLSLMSKSLTLFIANSRRRVNTLVFYFANVLSASSSVWYRGLHCKYLCSLKITVSKKCNMWVFIQAQS